MARVDLTEASERELPHEPPEKTLDAAPDSRASREGRIALIRLWLAHALLALIAGLLVRAETHPLVEWLLLGAVLSQWALLAAWAVLGTQSLFTRQACALGTCILFSLITTYAQGDPPHSALLGPADILSWLTTFSGSQIPFWIARLGWNWRLTTDSQTAPANRLPQFSLRWLMLLVLGCSVLFALVRFSVSAGYLADLLFFMVAGAVGSALLAIPVVPLIAAMMTVKKLRWIGAAILGVIVMATIVPWPAVPNLPPIGIVFTLGFAGVVAGTLYVLRLGGYRLSTTHYRGGRKATPLV